MFVSVSYTHLDVYKRQLISVTGSEIMGLKCDAFNMVSIPGYESS